MAMTADENLEMENALLPYTCEGEEEWPEERIQALVDRYEQTDQLALQEAFDSKREWD